MLTSGRNGTIYTGVTSDIVRRVYQHKAKVVQGFTARYDVKHLVWFEVHQSIVDAIQREKNLKHWSRAWKIALIEKTNPTWRDLYGDLAG
jgi:putative endonuclease